MNRIIKRCVRCKRMTRIRAIRCYSTPSRPSISAKPTLDLFHIRNNPDLYAQNCLSRNSPNLASNPSRIVKLMYYDQALQYAAKSLRERSNALQKKLVLLKAEGKNIEGALKEARETETKLLEVEDVEEDIMSNIEELALALPNLASKDTPKTEFEPVCHVNADEKTIQIKDSKGNPIHHAEIGKQLGIIDFACADAASGRGWYYLVGAGALLEQALVSYALTFAAREGWTPVTAPSIVYSQISAACGYQPLDSSGKQQIYNIAQDEISAVHEMSLTRTSDIALAAMRANTVISEDELPLRRVAASRCYRPEARRNAEGRYNVHEFTNVELFAWMKPEEEEMGYFFDEIIDIQTDILGALGLTCRVLDMPVHKLSAREARRVSIEAFFPSCAVGDTPDEVHDAAWREIASVSFCTDYQSRRLATRIKDTADGTLRFPWTVSATLLAVPRVVAALLEIGWDANEGIVRLPKVLHQFMGTDKIEGRKRD
ncbi:seryl-tRNA synthetase [Fusarium tjaetaba]|uniref:serine--tRNA ligase n=1 Tax=Fusarium tjaetaba TaxID=1567544 RepID=A0A8H5S5S0_9HYPO|nr:seryl-tRNA synthetase [Fusarium tjaetaba]KAF5647051.1 seryl-tRNA synthetase [Fusarium tjaetaba]